MRSLTSSTDVAVGIPTVVPTAPVQTAAPLGPMIVPTQVVGPSSTSVAAPTPVAPVGSAANAAPAATNVAGSSLPTAIPPTALPTVDPQIAAEVRDAYQRYWDVTAQALRDLDASRLSEVAMDGELAALQKNIDNLRAQGRAIDTSVEHHFVVVWNAGDQAQVVDRYRDRSVYIDPVTKQPLPGEVVPATFDDAPESNVVYLLQREQGTWKVVGYNDA
jgi:hypothetical protein